MLADVLPDRFGNALIEAWLASQGRDPADFDPVERLCYTGSRGMGALEFEPAIAAPARASERLDVAALVELASEVLADRAAFVAKLADGEPTQNAVRDILRVGTSAGGARAKAVVAWNPDTGELRSGQVDSGSGFSQWILKFDGIAENRDKELADSRGYGRIEYAYHLMAAAAGIEMTECRLLHENGRSHFMTRRFDRGPEGKLHLQSLCALAHLDFNLAGAHAYEQAMLLMRRLDLPMASLEQQFTRMVFNVLARNQDDHTKNIAFLMDKAGAWSLSPAFDVTYAYNPDGPWTGRHQMSLQGKRDDFTLADFEACGKAVSLRRGRARALVEEVRAAVTRWPEFAEAAGVPEASTKRVAGAHRTLPKHSARA
jgi:serine/threonine-protein kinase HipA